jgi:hypothetical protein
MTEREAMETVVAILRKWEHRPATTVNLRSVVREIEETGLATATWDPARGLEVVLKPRIETVTITEVVDVDPLLPGTVSEVVAQGGRGESN